MKKNINLSVIFVLYLFTLNGCNAQSHISVFRNPTSIEVEVDSVRNHIVKDSLYCNYFGRVFTYDFLWIAHPDLLVSNSINAFFINENGVPINNSVEHLNKNIERTNLKEAIREVCDNNEYPSLNEYFVLFNKKNIFTVQSSTYDIHGKASNSYYNFSLKTGLKLTDIDVFITETVYVLNQINGILKDKLLSNYHYFEENAKDSNEFRCIVNELKDDNYLLKSLPTYIFSTIKQQDGILFQVPIGDEFYFFDYAYRFFSFEELTPYLTKAFKNQIGLK